jgi:Ran GTPase-activating protein (RanGAP) involved in mRNA processing and transport
MLDIKLDLSDNSLGVQGAALIGSIPFSLTNIHTLNLSDNELGEEGIAQLAEGLCSNTSIRSLILDRNFLKAGKQRQAAITNLIKLISSNKALEGNHKIEIRNRNFFLFLFLFC